MLDKVCDAWRPAPHPASNALPQAAPSCRQQASAAALAQVYWQPVAVQQAHGQGVAAVQQPLDVSNMSLTS